MNTTYSMRVENDLKKKFLEKSKAQWLDGSTLLRYFMKSYVERDDIVKIDIEEELFDAMFQDSRVIKELEKLSDVLDKVWF